MPTLLSPADDEEDQPAAPVAQQAAPDVLDTLAPRKRPAAVDVSRGDPLSYRGDMRKWFKDDVDAAEKTRHQNDVLDTLDANARQRSAGAAQKQQQRDSAAAAKQAKRDMESAKEADFRTRGVQHFTDANGEIQPIKDEKGNMQFHPQTGEVQYDEKGQAFRENRTASGAKPKEYLDADAKIGTHPTRQGELYKQNKNAPWDFLGTVDDGLQSPDPDTRAAAVSAKGSLDKHLHTAARDGFKLAGDDIASQERDAGIAFSQQQKQAEGIQKQIEAVRANPSYNANDGGVVWGIGKKPTGEATALKAQEAELQQQLEKATATAPDPKAFREQRRQNELRAQSFDALVAKHGVDGALDEWKAQVTVAGQDPASDPVVKSIEDAREKAGLSRAKKNPEKDAQERALREHPVFGPLMQERDALDAGWQSKQTEIANKQQATNAQLAPLRAQLDTGKAQMDELGAQAQRIEQQIAKVLPGEGSISDKLAKATPAQFAAVQPLTQQYSELLSQHAALSAQLAPVADQHNALAQAANEDVTAAQATAQAEQQMKTDELQFKMQQADELVRVSNEEKQKKQVEALNGVGDLASLRAKSKKKPIFAEGSMAEPGAQDAVDFDAENVAHEQAKKDFPQKREEMAKATGLKPEQVDDLLDDQDTLTSIPKGKAVKLKFSGAVAVSPELALDEEKWNAAVDATGAKAKAKAKAKAARLKLRDGPAGEAAYDALLESSDFKKFADGAEEDYTAGETVERYFKARKGSITPKIEAILQAVKGQFASIGQQFFGAAAGVTGNKTMTDLMQQTSMSADRAGAAREALGGAGAAGFLVDVAGSIIPSLALSPLAKITAAGASMATAGRVASGAMTAAKANAITATVAEVMMAGIGGVQSYGGLYADAYKAYLDNGLAPKDARQKAQLPALASAITTFALSSKFTGGVEKAGHAVKAEKEAAKKALRSYLGTAAEDMGDEAVEEFLDQLAQGIYAKASYDPNKSGGDILSEAAMAGVQGGIGGAVVGTIGHHDERRAAFSEDLAHYGDYNKKAQTVRDLLSVGTLERMGAFAEPSREAAALGAKSGADIRAQIESADAKIDQLAEAAKSATGLKAQSAAAEELAQAHDARNQAFRTAQENQQIEGALSEIESIAPDTHESLATVDPASIESTKTVARALVKIARGATMESLTASERAAVDAPTPDGLPRVEMLKGGDGQQHAVITDGAISRLRAVAPTAADLIGKDEATRRADILAKEKPSATPAPEASTGQPAGPQPQPAPAAQGNQNVASPTSTAPAENLRPLSDDEHKRVRVLRRMLTNKGVGDDLAERVARGYVSEHGANGAPATHKDGVLAALKAAGGHTFDTQPDAKLRSAANKAALDAHGVKDAQNLDEAHTENVKRHFKGAVESLTKKGVTLTPDRLKKLAEAVQVFSPALARWEKAFDKGGVEWQGEEKGSGGAFSGGAGNITFSIGDILGANWDGNDLTFRELRADPERAEKIVREEAIHAWAQQSVAKERAAEIWNGISEQARQMTRELYLGAGEHRKAADGTQQVKDASGAWVTENPSTMFHEFFRFVVEGKMDPKTIAGAEQASPTILKQIMAILKRAIAFFSNTAAKLREQGVEESIVAELDAAADQCAEAMAKISADAEATDPYLSQYVAQRQQTSNRSRVGGLASGRTTAPAGKGGTLAPVQHPKTGGKGQGGAGISSNATGSDADSDATRKKLADLQGQVDAQKAKEEAIRERRNLGVAAVAGRLADFAEVLQQVPEDARTEAGALLDKAVHGDATYVVGSNYTRYPASYIALAPGVAQASHLPSKNFAVNPEYGNGAVQNTRDYEKDATEQGKVRKMAAAGAYDEGGEVTDVKSAAEGPIQLVLAVFKGADGKPTVRFIAAGGNGRLQGKQSSSIEDQQRLSDEWQRKQANFGFTSLPDGYDGYRFLGVYDLRNEAQRTAYQTLVDKLNPSSGVVQDAGKRARIDAGDKIPVSAFADLPLSLSASQATEAVKSWVRDAEKYGLDRNLMASIAGDPPSAQSYARQLILHGAFRSPALTTFYFDQHGGSGTATAKGLIEASARAALAMREKGFDAAADALGKTLATVVDYVKNGTRIDRALTKAAEQMEMGKDASLVNTIAQAMKDKVEVFAPNKRGIANVDAESTVEGFNELMDDIARGVSQFSPDPDLLGETDTLEANIARGLAAHARRGQEHSAAPVQSGQPMSKRARDQHADARRMRELQQKSREEGLTQMEGLEMEGLERRAGQSFMGFFNELRPGFKLSQEQGGAASSMATVPMQQGALLSKKSADGTPGSEYRSNRHERDTKQPAKTTASHGAGSPDASAEPLPGQGELQPRARGVVGGRGGQPGEVAGFDGAKGEAGGGQAASDGGNEPAFRRELDSRGRDLRLVKLFGEDWQYGWNAPGLPNQPTPLREGHPLIANKTNGKTVAILTEKSKAVRLGLLPAGRHSRTDLRENVIRYFLAGGDGETRFDDLPQMHAGEPEIMLLGGGGGAGKSSMLGKLTERGEFDTKNRVLINPDEIREFLPEFETVRDLGDARGSSVSHEEAGAIADELYAETLARKLSITYDATLKNGEKWLAEIARLQAEGYRVRMVAVTIDPHEALVRAYLRGKSKGRYVPDEELFKAHKGFNAALPGYADALGHEITIYDNTPLHAIRIAPDEMKSGPAREITDRRAQLDPLAKDLDSLLASYGEGMQSAAPMSKRAKADPNQTDIFANNPLTITAPASKDNHHGTKPLSNTDRGNAPKSAQNGGMGELFQFMAGHREAERREGVAGRRQGGIRGRAGQQDLGLFADDGGRMPDGASGGDAGAIPDVGGDGAADARPLRAGESANAGDRPGRGAGSAGGDAADGGGRGTSDSHREGSDGRGAGGRREPGLVERPADPLARNYVIQRGADLSPRGLVTKLRANLDAIRLLKQIEGEKRHATDAERAALVKYSGWGALSQAFDEEKANRIASGEVATRKQTAETYRSYGDNEYYQATVKQQEEQIAKLENWQSKWGEHHAQLKQELTPEEYRRAMNSTINAHYTAPEIISNLWDVASRLGFKGGNVLEPAAGVGHFLGLMPQSIAERSKSHAVELDDLSGRITRMLYPETDVQVTGFQSADIADGSIDLAISNVPFANVPVSDKALEAMDGPVDNLHDYFFGKTLTKLRPGGLAIFITSAFTMDKGNAKNRRWLAERADLVAAFRLPNDAFKANAGTDVVTDVIVLRKKDGGQFAHAQDWTTLDDATTHDGQPVRVNQYFAAHPGNVLGLLADDGSMYGDEKEMTVHSDPNRPVEVAIQQAIDSLPSDVAGEGAGREVRTGESVSAVKMGNIVLRDGKFFFNGQTEPDADLNDPKNTMRVTHFLDARNSLNKQYELELSPDATDAEIEENRRVLNENYDFFKFKYGDFHQTKNRSLFIDDPDYFRLAGAEVPESINGGAAAMADAAKGRIKQKFTKADVFSRRVLSPRVEPTKANSLEDAFGISLGWRGRVDLPFIASLTGQSPEQVERGLVEREIVVRDPESGQVVSRENYMAGNVRRKMEVAKASGPDYARNVRILEPVIPRDVTIDEARFKIGATWIPSDVYQGFLSSLGMNGVKISYHQPVGGGRDFWHVDDKRASRQGVAYKDYGTARIGVVELMDSLLNFNRINIEHTDKDLKGKTDIAATQAANEAAKKLNEHFIQWARTTPAIAEKLAPIFNKEVNAFAQRTYDGQHLTFPWASNDFDIFPDKKNVVWRAIQDGFGLIAHGVGGGKTIVGSAIALELRRLGMARKPMVVVHNATLEQFAATIAQIAPSARVLVGRKDELAGAKRKEFLMRIAAGDWDAVVVAHSTFGLIEDDPEYQSKHMQAIVDEVMQSLADSGYGSIEDAKKGGRKDMSVKQRVKTVETLTGKIEELSKRRTDTGLLNFQQLGVDALIVDEIHEFKKMPFSTKLDVKGIDSGMSAKGYAMLMRARNIQERMGGKNVFTMTGTPVTNTLGEVWNMVRLVAPHLLKEYKVETFDQFVSKFAEVETVSEETPSGERKMVERLSKVVNLPEWSTFFRMAADVKFGDAMTVKGRPGIKGGKPELSSVERTPGVGAWVDYIRGVLEAFSHLGKKDFEANPSLSAVPVQAYQASRAAAIDIRMVEPRAKDEPGSKANRMIARAMEIYKRTSHYSGTQVIFADSYRTVKTSIFSGVTSGSTSIELDPEKEPGGTFNLYEDIKAKMVSQGVPAEQIAIISDPKYDNQTAKTALFKAVNEGRVRIIMGSTQKLGTGVNMQRLMAAAHHLDVPWTPAGLEQRDGRVYRQGNIHGEMGVDVELVRYGMKDSLDSALWQKLETKQRFITLSLSGKIVGRDLEEADDILTLAEQRAILSGPYGQETFELESRIRELYASRAGHDANAAARSHEIRSAKRALASQGAEDAKAEPAIAAMREVGQRVSKDGAKITVNGKAFATKSEMMDAVKAEIETAKGTLTLSATGKQPLAPVDSIRVNDLPIRLRPSAHETFSSFVDGTSSHENVIEFALTAPMADSPDFGRVTSAATLLARLEEAATTADGITSARKTNVERVHQLANMSELGAWAHAGELDKALDRLADLKRLESARTKDKSKPAEAPAQDDIIRSKPAREPFVNGDTVGERASKNMQAAYAIADAWTNIPGSDKDDRRSAARKALVNAARAYDPSRGDFGPLAGTAIRNALRDLHAEQTQYTRRNLTTLDAPIADGEDDTHKENVADTGADVTRGVESREASQILDELIASLPQHLRDVVLGVKDGKSLTDIGRDLGGITKQGVARRAQVGMEKLRHALSERGIRGADDVIRSRPARSSANPDDEMHEQMSQLQRMAEAEKPGARTIGHPKLSLGALDELVMAVDEWRKTYLQPETHQQWDDEAEKMLANDYEGTKRRIMDIAARGDQLRDAEVKAAMKIVAKEVQRASENPDDAALQRDVQQLVNSYRQARAEQARGLAAGRDPFQSPAERYREFLAKVIYQAPPAVQAKLDAAETPEERKAILSEDQKRIARIQKALADMGITFEDIFSGEVELQLKNRKIAAAEIDAAKGKDADILKAFMDKRNFAAVAAEMKVPEADVRRVVQAAAERVKQRHFQKFEKGATMQNVVRSKPAVAPSVSPAESEFAKFLDSLGLTEETPKQQQKRAARVAKKGRPFDISDPVSVVRIARTIQSVDSGMLDMAMEYWMNNILSGPTTHLVNIAGNAVNAAWDMTVQRGTEALMNKAFGGRADQAQLGEAKYLLRGIMPGIQRARQLAEMAWTAEYDFTEHVLLGKPVDLQEISGKVAGKSAIRGVAGRVIRVPGRALLCADSFFKGLIATMEVGAQAFRVAKAEGLTGKAMEDRIKEQVDTHGSPAWVAAVEKAKELTFQEDLKGWKTAQNPEGTYNPAEAIAFAVQKAAYACPPLRFIVPFVKTPFNIMRTGIRKTPLGSLPLAWDVLSYATLSGKNFLAKMTGNQVTANPKLPATFTRDFAEQAIAWAIMSFIWGAAQGDDDDDKKSVLITGSSPKGEATWGESELQRRAHGGDYTLRIGNTRFNYGRYEPFATVIGTMVDAARVLKSPRTDANKMDALWGYAVAQAEGKSFLRGIGDMLSAVRDGKGMGDKAARILTEALVPNIIRSPLRNLDDHVRDGKGGGLPYAAFPIAENAPEKHDIYGRPVEKDGGIARLILPTPLKVAERLEPTDRLLLNWNRNNPSEKWAPQPPERTYRDHKTGKDVEMTPAQYAEHTQKVGKRVLQKLAGKVTESAIHHPTEKDVDVIKKAFTESRREVRDEQFGKKPTRAPLTMW